jgi:hypothetical protein
MIKIHNDLRAACLQAARQRFPMRPGQKVSLLEKHYDAGKGTPAFTPTSRYTTPDRT